MFVKLNCLLFLTLLSFTFALTASVKNSSVDLKIGQHNLEQNSTIGCSTCEDILDAARQLMESSTTWRRFLEDSDNLSAFVALRSISGQAEIAIDNPQLLALAGDFRRKPELRSHVYPDEDAIPDFNRVRAWEVAFSANLPQAIRRNPVDLEKISRHLAITGKSTDDLVAELAGNAKTASGDSRAWLDIIPNGGGATIGSRGNYVQKESGEVIYRTISQSDYDQLLSSGRMPGTTETSTSPLQAFSEDYDGVLVKYYVNLGTIDDLRVIGRTDGSNLVRSQFGEMPQAVSGWIDNFIRFKKEGTQVNIQLGRGPGIDIFNNNLIAFERVIVP